MDLNSEAIVYLKDLTFIPDHANINLGVGIVAFHNSDSISHSIQCKIRDMSELTIPAGKCVEISFPFPGRFEFSSTVYGLMKCIIEVEEDNDSVQDISYSEEWSDLTYHLSKPRLTSRSSLNDLLQSGSIGVLGNDIPYLDDVHGDAKAMLNRQRLLWSKHLHQNTIDPPPNDSTHEFSCSDSSSDEGFDFTSQRNLIRNKAQLTKPDQLQHQEDAMQHLYSKSRSSDSFDDEGPAIDPIDSSEQKSSGGSSKKSGGGYTASSGYIGTAKDNATLGTNDSPSVYIARTRGAHRPSAGSSEIVKPSSHPFPPQYLTKFGAVIEIRDYDFDRRNIIVPAGAPVEFRLHPQDVPLHVEHVLEGRSISAELCFISPILQLPFSRQFEFVPSVPGEIYVSCQIYPDMLCRVVVMPTLPPRVAHTLPWSSTQRKKTNGLPSPLRVGSVASVAALSRLNGSFPAPAQRQGRQLTLDSSLSPYGNGAGSTTHPFSPTPQPCHSPQMPHDSWKGSQNYLVHGEVGLGERFWLRKSNSTSSFGDVSDTLSSSVMDSDDGPDEYYTDMQPPPLPLSKQLSADDMVETSESVFGKDDYEDMVPPFGYAFENTYGQYEDSTDTHPDAVVYVEDFKFQPFQLVIPLGSIVKFQSVSHASMHKLTCVGAFEGVTLECSQSSTFLHHFDTLGEFCVKNEIFSFMECVICVVPVKEVAAAGEEENSADDKDKEFSPSPTFICPIDHNKYDPILSGNVALTDDVKKYYDHIDGLWQHCNDENKSVVMNQAHLNPLTLLGSFSRLPNIGLGGDSPPLSSAKSSPAKAEQQFLKASVDWGLAVEDLSDDDVDIHDSDDDSGRNDDKISTQAGISACGPNEGEDNIHTTAVIQMMVAQSSEDELGSGSGCGSGYGSGPGDSTVKKKRKKRKKKKSSKIAIEAGSSWNGEINVAEGAVEAKEEDDTTKAVTTESCTPDTEAVLSVSNHFDLNVVVESQVFEEHPPSPPPVSIQTKEDGDLNSVQDVSTLHEGPEKSDGGFTTEIPTEYKDTPSSAKKSKKKKKGTTQVHSKSVLPISVNHGSTLPPLSVVLEDDGVSSAEAQRPEVPIPVESPIQNSLFNKQKPADTQSKGNARVKGDGKVTTAVSTISSTDQSNHSDVKLLENMSKLSMNDPSSNRLPRKKKRSDKLTSADDKSVRLLTDPVSSAVGVGVSCNATSASAAPISSTNLSAATLVKNKGDRDRFASSAATPAVLDLPPSPESEFTIPTHPAAMSKKPNKLISILHSASAALRSKAKHESTASGVIEPVLSEDLPDHLMLSPSTEVSDPSVREVSNQGEPKENVDTAVHLHSHVSVSNKTIHVASSGGISDFQHAAEKEIRDFFMERWTDLCRKRSEGIDDVLPRGTPKPVVRIRSSLISNSTHNRKMP